MTEIKKVSNVGKTRTIEIKVKTKKSIPKKTTKDDFKKSSEEQEKPSKRSVSKKTIELRKNSVQNLKQKNQVESEITTVNEFKKKSFESDKKNILVEDKQQKITKKPDEKKNDEDFTNSPAKKKEQLDFIKKKSEINKTLATKPGVWKSRTRIKKD